MWCLVWLSCLPACADAKPGSRPPPTLTGVASLMHSTKPPDGKMQSITILNCAIIKQGWAHSPAYISAICYITGAFCLLLCLPRHLFWSECRSVEREPSWTLLPLGTTACVSVFKGHQALEPDHRLRQVSLETERSRAFRHSPFVSESIEWTMSKQS